MLMIYLIQKKEREKKETEKKKNSTLLVCGGTHRETNVYFAHAD